MKLHLTPLTPELSMLVVVVHDEVIVEYVHINELTQRVLNYASIPSFSRAYHLEEDPC